MEKKIDTGNRRQEITKQGHIKAKTKQNKEQRGGGERKKSVGKGLKTERGL